MSEPTTAAGRALPNCGDHPKFGPQPLFLGCGEVIDGLAYRCAQCDTLFHRVCIRQHFGWPEAGGSLMPHALDEGLAALASSRFLDLDAPQTVERLAAAWRKWVDTTYPDSGNRIAPAILAALRREPGDTR